MLLSPSSTAGQRVLTIVRSIRTHIRMPCLPGLTLSLVQIHAMLTVGAILERVCHLVPPVLQFPLLLFRHGV